MDLIVFTYTAVARETELTGMFPKDDDCQACLMPVGRVPDYADHEVAVLERAKEQFSGIGQIAMMVSAVRDDCGWLGGLLAPALIVKTYADTALVFGFVPLFDHTGFFAPIKHEIMVGREISRHDHDGKFKPRHKDGAQVISLVPLGQLGWNVALEDDPDHFYLVPYDPGVSGMEIGSEVAIRVRAWREENPA